MPFFNYFHLFQQKYLFFQLRQEKVQLEHTLEQEQECLVNKLMRRIEKLETETTSKQTRLVLKRTHKNKFN